MNKILFEIFNEAGNGEIIIDNDPFYIAFNTIITDKTNNFSNIKNENYPTLIIDNLEIFENLLIKYIEISLASNRKIPFFVTEKEKNNIKYIISYLFTNATTEDFKNPIKFIEKNIEFYNNPLLNETLIINTNILDSNLEIKNNMQSLSMETPYKLETKLINTINNNEVFYNLPTISYGITNDTCYIYSIINEKKQTNSNELNDKYNKKIKRELYKLNQNVFENESDEFKQYKSQNSEYYPENISDISVSSLIPLTVLINILERKNINKIKLVPYLPIRYLSRELASNNINDINKKEEFKLRNYEIQKNITEKFIRTFNRLTFHLDGIEITSYPYEISEFLEAKINNIKEINNPILENIYNELDCNLSKRIK